MSERRNPYSAYEESQLILRDQLAIDRTVLANERTFLSYTRTGLAFALTGTAGIRFFDGVTVWIFCGIMILFGLLICILGLLRFRSIHQDLPLHRRLESAADMRRRQDGPRISERHREVI